MKLLLTSAGMNIQEEVIKILPKTTNQLKLGHIITASKPEMNIDYVQKDKEKMTKLGMFEVEDIDIEGKNEKELRQTIANKDAIFIQGGNTFYLLKHVRLSGFDKVIKEFINKGLIYIGISAGSYITCPTIEQSFWNDKNVNTFGMTDLSALSLVPFVVVAHFDEKYRSNIEQRVKTTKYPVVALNDHQAILVKDDKYKIVGSEEKVFFNGFKENWK